MAKIYTTVYSNFKGVDMASDPTKIDNSRSPYAPNLVSDNDNFPEKRVGWRRLHQVDSPVNGIFYAKLKGEKYYFVHGGTKLYRWNLSDAPQEIEGVQIRNGKSSGFVFNDKFYLLTGAEYLVCEAVEGEAEGEYQINVKDATEDAYVPTVVIGRAPSGGGTPLYSVNLLQKKRTNSFLADGEATVYQLTSDDIESVDKVMVNGEEVENSDTTTKYTVDAPAGKVTFTTAPGKPTVTGQDNVQITFTKTTKGYQNRILGCTICTQYGYGNTDRVIVSGNPDYPNTDWISNINDPTYFPDMNYSNVGVSGTAIMGYARVGEYLAIIKEDNAQDSTIFFRSASYDGTTITFPLKQGIAGIGAIAPGSFATIDDEPLFLARTGVYAITSNLINAERTVQNRSYYVDPALTKEPNLAGAIAVNWNNKYLVCVNNNCYVLDGNQPKSYVSKTNGDYIYECYHWNNIPAVCFFEHDGDLYFGKADGWICRFNNDLAMSERPMEAYSDNWHADETKDNSEAIYCQWATKADDDGDFMTLKTMPKKGSGIQIKPYQRSSVEILVRTDRDTLEQSMTSAYMDIWNWSDIDFERISFNSNDAPQVVPMNFKVKKYKTLQFIVRNKAKNEGFGILGIIKRYVKGNYAKG
ncbi:hypothetical protein H8711_09820 [Clostridiaceae bacterium NSJ-31]|jgi:hypothetical protein|uniref:Uncharacterized protein n=1 Tax=Ligaoa zhengdingensis TaxID=2763658 RepID=A0A926I591_9FIRM|nr:hypothetical protein [Ligaoa zhengdingensis]MBC8547220.1 hypothetical protein [Ligaoa zhengdingensis]DAV16744.1 MAG TPA: stabilization protein [Caudoviricetes sp.]